jgi:hypothetical protein
VGLGLQGGPAPQPGAAQELTIVSRPSKVMRGVHTGELTIGKLVDGRLVAFLGSACYPCRLFLRAAPPMPGLQLIAAPRRRSRLAGLV